MRPRRRTPVTFRPQLARIRLKAYRVRDGVSLGKEVSRFLFPKNTSAIALILDMPAQKAFHDLSLRRS